MVVLLSKYPDGLMVSSTSAIYPVDDPKPRQVVPNRRGLVLEKSDSISVVHPRPLAVGELAEELGPLISIPVIAVMVVGVIIAAMVIVVMVVGVIIAVTVVICRSRYRRDCAKQ
jgi:hypothetical protein